MYLEQIFGAGTTLSRCTPQTFSPMQLNIGTAHDVGGNHRPKEVPNNREQRCPANEVYDPCGKVCEHTCDERDDTV
ncbi:hypothetical protein ANCDUO_02542 [Ancylostoma duodenale]|uniref:Uncharacterized protein n=1 Tax=Ancylostoma duodenale TaxID=51022 RepID=A0A0C2DBF8_9BILA|nr:hypothetical protein ANCDUO_02542 [Ancylostoma duodenale]